MITPIVTAITREVFATCPAGAEGSDPRDGRDALGDDPRRGVPAQPQRCGRGGDHRLRPRGRRDDRGGARRSGRRRSSRRTSSGPGDTMASIIANQFGEASGIQRSALIGFGLVLLIMTIVVGSDRPRRAAPGEQAPRGGALMATATAPPTSLPPSPSRRCCGRAAGPGCAGSGAAWRPRSSSCRS